MAREIGIHPSLVNRWEKGRQTPYKTNIKRIAALCNDPEAGYRYLINGGDLPPELVYGGIRGTPVMVQEPPAPATAPDGDTRFAEGYRAGFDAGFEKGRQLGGPPDPARNRVPNLQ